MAQGESPGDRRREPGAGRPTGAGRGPRRGPASREPRGRAGGRRGQQGAGPGPGRREATAAGAPLAGRSPRTAASAGGREGRAGRGDAAEGRPAPGDGSAPGTHAAGRGGRRSAGKRPGGTRGAQERGRAGRRAGRPRRGPPSRGGRLSRSPKAETGEGADRVRGRRGSEQATAQCRVRGHGGGQSSGCTHAREYTCVHAQACAHTSVCTRAAVHTRGPAHSPNPLPHPASQGAPAWLPFSRGPTPNHFYQRWQINQETISTPQKSGLGGGGDCPHSSLHV